ESELFGREKGAYTGALSRQIGRFELAHGSTLFLDEIGELPVELQVKLLRVLEEKEIERLGSSKRIPVDVRIIAASNRDLQREMREGRFRQDLYYRLCAFPITVPPLRERPGDIPILVRAFIEELSATLGKRIDCLAGESVEALRRYPWPGNVRELRNVVERAIIMAQGPDLTVLPPDEPVLIQSEAPPGSLTLRSVESEHIRRVLSMTGGRIRGRQGAAEILGMNPTTLESRMIKLGISRVGVVPTK
ncbi:MAG: sigma 54-interacting transcriptional regulator, partial [Phycisphaerales bacterium]